MTATRSAAPDGMTIGRGALRQLREGLLRHAPDHAVNILQQAGFAAGEGIYRAFQTWLPGQAGVTRPEELDAAQLNDVLSAFFQAAGWGAVTVAALGPAPADPLQQLVRVPRRGGILDATGDLAALDAIGERHRVTERPADHVPLPHADQLVHDQAVSHIAQQATPELAHRVVVPASRFPDDDVRVPRHRFGEDAPLPVPRAARVRARRGLEIIDEAAQAAAR